MAPEPNGFGAIFCISAGMLNAIWLAPALALGLLGGGQQLVMAPSHVVPAARISLNLGKDANGNTTVDLKAQHLAQPASLQPSEAIYMVWVEPAGQPAQRKGMLLPNKDLNAELKFITPEQHFELFITAEHSDEPSSPSGVEVVRGSIARGQ